eukprot:5153477-Amphidinium_carterae.1
MSSSSQPERVWNPYLRNAVQQTQSFGPRTSVRLHVAWSSQPTCCGARNSRVCNNGLEVNDCPIATGQQ